MSFPCAACTTAGTPCSLIVFVSASNCTAPFCSTSFKCVTSLFISSFVSVLGVNAKSTFDIVYAGF